MDEATREDLIERVNRKTATVGASTPETLTVDGKELALREFIIETRSVDRIPPDAEETLTKAKRTLRRERGTRMDRLESDPLDVETAERLADEIIGIDRALNALENIRRPDFADEDGAASIEDHKRWVGFLDEIQR
ncbi:DUF5788 family protein [Salinibaculum rarum]|uniref:DUF5788 family protein n=1 Tax=Salinibaculum rarum TaxID=3058903 RepID=UPI00265FC3D5|nr:DUF5788 family protein [Salinibaculum sp. KK48]